VSHEMADKGARAVLGNGRAPGQVAHALELTNLLAGGDVPEPQVLAEIPRERLAAIGREGRYPNLARVASESPYFLAGLQLPEAHVAIVAAAQNLLAVWRDRYAPASLALAKGADQFAAFHVPQTNGVAGGDGPLAVRR